ncbi:MAG: homogentisate 1,2-dioxygenase [Armatimonadetes bacterium]|nr:homogentisate 1,2-dioxygenase [Armatimonadota bacterium]MDE2206406.1 homogentisate 1,2-dioxygenase [Armatimonadota bacterium]
MPGYMQLGQIPRKRHTQFRKADGGLYSEQLFGTRGFSGIASLLYHIHPPTQVMEWSPVECADAEMEEHAALHHRHLRTGAMEPYGDPVSGRIPLMQNADVRIGICVPAAPMPYFYKNADGDDLLFVHRGSGRLETMFGALPFGVGDYLVVPRGTIYRIVTDGAPARFLVIESATPIQTPKRYRNEYGQLLEHAPYCERDMRGPSALETHDEADRFEVRIRARGAMASYWYPFHPLDVVGWDGFVYPWAFNIADFEPITGSLHQPPPVHQTFEAANFVVCSFVPRMLDYHPNAIPVPYNHSNVDSDEMIYYVNSRFGSRRGIEEGSITLHPSGLPHGPQPGVVESSLGQTRTEELAVMVDTFRPLQLSAAALPLEDAAYPMSWNPAT